MISPRLTADCSLPALPATGVDARVVLVVALVAVATGTLLWRSARHRDARLFGFAAPLLLVAVLGVPAARPVQTAPCPPTTTSPVATTPAPSTTVAAAGPTGAPMVLRITVAAGDVMQLPLFGTVDVRIDWGDGAPDGCPTTSTASGLVQCTYTAGGNYTITIGSGSGAPPWLTAFGRSTPPYTYAGVSKITEVISFGDLGTTSLASAFARSTANTVMPAGIPATVTSLWGMFDTAVAFNQDLSSWDTSNVTDMSYVFYAAAAFDGDIGGWDTGKVTTMNGMFVNAAQFNQDIGGWDTSKVTIMSSLFSGASSFNQDIGGWNTASVTNMASMFRNAAAFDQGIGGWNTSKVTNMHSTLEGAVVFNHDIGGWDTGAVTDMADMFHRALLFDQGIGGWNTSAVTNMGGTFNGAEVFDQDLSGWCVTNIASMPSNFDLATTAWTNPAWRPVWGTCPA